jgi:hypothetical protein
MNNNDALKEAYKGILDIVEQFIKDRPDDYPRNENWHRNLIDLNAVYEILEITYQDSGQNIESRLTIFTGNIKKYLSEKKLFKNLEIIDKKAFVKPPKEEQILLIRTICNGFNLILSRQERRKKNNKLGGC